MTKLLVSILTLSFISFPLFAEGFQAGTLVKTPRGYFPIESIETGDLITTCDFLTPCVEKRVVAVKSHQSHEAIEVKIKDETLVVESDHLIFSEHLNSFVPANTYEHNLILEPVELYSLSIEDTHNFYVTESDIIAHNFAIAIPVFTWVIGEGVIWAGGAALTAVTVALMNENTKDRSRGGNSKDKGQIDDISKRHGIKDRRDFGRYVEEHKKNEGRRGADNLSWGELNDLAQEYKQNGGK